MTMKNKFRIDEHRNLYNEALRLYKKSRTDNLEDFPMSERRKYYKNGNRNDFEKLYFGRRDYLSSVAILALFDEKYIPELERIILAVCNEYCWALPAHVIGLKVIDKRIIDLFVAETSFVLAEICSVFETSLSDKVLAKVKSEIKCRMVNNFRRYRFWWEKCNMNWAAVCGAYVGGTLIYLFHEEFERQKGRILKTLGCYIDGFTDDGFCLEGPLYWLYGFFSYSVFAHLLYLKSDGKEDLFADKKVKKIASYGGNCMLKGNTSVSFSDADMNFRPDFALQSFLYDKLSGEIPYIPKENLCFYGANTKWMNYYRALIWQCGADSNSEKAENSIIYSPKANQLIVNKESYSFAFKGGHNCEPHNHNDLGSFIFSDKDGQVFCDLGSGRYTKDYFDESKRYGIFCNSSLSHSVPIVDGSGQKAGESYSAVLVFDSDNAVCEFSGAYENENLTSLSRKAKFKENSVVITDTFTFSDKISVTERFVSKRKAEIGKGMLVLGETKLRYPEDKAVLKISEEKHTPHEYDKEDETIYCYDFILNDKADEISFEITTK